jgi:poly-gamma-glutamate capsule biosynthesis protein CapA/YwtB (metallophosphatase superfamily)
MAGPTPPPSPGSLSSSARFLPLRLRFLGDVILGRYHTGRFRPIAGQTGPDLFALRDWLTADVVLANLETPVVANLPPQARAKSGSFFGATPQMLSPLFSAGISYVGIANNHAHDLGDLGLLETPHHAESVGLTPIGRARAPDDDNYFQQVNLDRATLDIAAITTLRNFEPKESDLQIPYVPVRELGSRLGPRIAEIPRDHIVIVFVHWGQEDDPSPGLFERRAAHEWVDAGADLVIGHHPHVLQEIELYSGAVIAYSLGNFLFDSILPKRRVGAILAVDYLDPNWCDARVTVVPTEIQSQPAFHPEAASHAAAMIAHRAVMRRSTTATQHPRWKVDGTLLIGEIQRESCR